MKSKVIFICRDSLESKYIAKSLLENGYLDSLVIESGEIARKNKIKRIIKNNSIFMLPVIFINLVVLLIYNKISANYLKKNIDSEYANIPNILNIKDINEIECIDYISTFDNPIVIIFGTAIVKHEFLKNTSCKIIINIHNGIVPNYRNVHSDFWAMYNKDYNNIGTTLMEINEGVDTGKILDKRCIDYQNDNIFEVKLKNLILSIDLIIVYLDKILNKNEYINKLIQNESIAHSYNTPTTINLFEFLIRKGK